MNTQYLSAQIIKSVYIEHIVDWIQFPKRYIAVLEYLVAASQKS
jgi:hypothetical protein